MNQIAPTFVGKLKARLIPLLDISTWVLLLTSAVPMLLLNPAMVVTLVTWTAYGIALAGISVMLNRLVLPQIKLDTFLREALDNGNVAAGIVVAAVLLLLGIFFLTLIILPWATVQVQDVRMFVPAGAHQYAPYWPTCRGGSGRVRLSPIRWTGRWSRKAASASGTLDAGTRGRS